MGCAIVYKLVQFATISMGQIHFKKGKFDYLDLKNKSDELSSNCSNQNEKLALQFLSKLIKRKEEFSFFTSGSTGKPKQIYFDKKQIIQSAQSTIDVLKLKPNKEHFLICLNVENVAGAMMLARAFCVNANATLLEATSNPLKNILPKHSYTFASFVPLQLQKMFTEDKTAQKKLERFKNILVGGSSINPESEKKLATVKTKIWHTYGMTETLSHVALRRVGKEKNFTLLPNIKAKLTDENCLMICSPSTKNKWIETNDIVELKGRKLKLLGRKDFVINSGGAKLIPEKIETEIAKIVSDCNVTDCSFFISSLPDKLLGEKVVLFIETKKSMNKKVLKTIEIGLKKMLSKYELPKEIILKKQFVYTSNGKIDRILSKN